MNESNIIKTAAIGFPVELNRVDAIALLNQTLTAMQNERLNIISSTHVGDNVFMIEYREGV